MADLFDFAVIGAGMAGASLAAGLAPHARVVMLEAEERPGYHSTGRSAAFWTESYGGPGVVPLTVHSGPFLAERGLLRQRGALTLGRADEAAAVRAFAAEYAALGVRVELLDRAALLQRVPGLREDWVLGAFEPDCSDIDVAALHQHWLAEARRGGVELRCRTRLMRAERGQGAWSLQTESGETLRARVLINAAGGWADSVAGLAGLPGIGVQPYRRTVAQLQLAAPPPEDLPLTLGIDGSFYFKPEAGKLWLSPHDETPTPPCDAAPEELDVATAIDRFERVVDWRIVRIEHKWAGLRSFAPDRLPVYGFDPLAAGFFWFAGQGGFGIQTAPAAADLALRLLLGQEPGAVAPEPYGPARFR